MHHDPALTADAERAATAADAHRRQRRGTLQQLVARSVLFVAAYVVSATLARTLGPSAYGVYGVIASQLVWLEMVVHAGIPTATSKLIAEGRHDIQRVEQTARTVLVGVSVLVFVLCWLVAPAVAGVMQIPAGARLFRIAILDLPFAAIFVSYEGMLNGRRRYGVLAKSLVLFGVFKVGAVAALSLVGFSVEAALVAMVFATIAACIVMGFAHPVRGAAVDRPIVRELLGFAGALGVCLVSGQVLLNLDLWLLKSLWAGSGDVIGEYVASLNLARTLAVIPTVQAGVLFSSVAWAVASRDNDRVVRHIREASRFAIVVAAGVTVILGLNGGEVLALLFSRAYVEGRQFLPFQLIGFGVFAILDVFANALMAAGRQVVVAIVLTSVVPIIWICNLIFIPRFGAVGAALSMVIGVTIAAGVAGVMTWRQFGAPVAGVTIARVIAACTIVGVSSLAVSASGPLILLKLTALGVIFLATLYALGEITLADFGLQPAKSRQPAS